MLLARSMVWLAIAGFAATPGSAQTDAQKALAEAQKLETSGDSAKALEAYAWALDASGPGSSERAAALLGLATVETAQGKYPDARRHAAGAARIYEQLGDPARASAALNRNGLAALNAGDYADAGSLFAAAADRSAAAHFVEGQAEQIGNLANVHFYLGRYTDASRLYDQARTLTAAAPAAPWVGRRRRVLLANQATLFQRLGRDEEALAVYRELGASTELRPRERAQILVNLGVLYRHLGDPIKALGTYDEARALFAGDHDLDGELNAMKNRGIVLALDLGKLDEAEASFSAVVESAMRVGNRREMLHGRLYRGESALRGGHAERAGADFAAALALARELRTPEEEWKALYGLGRVTPDHVKAVAYLEDAIGTIEQIRDEIRVPSLRAEFLNDKREVYDALMAAILPTATPQAFFEILERSHSRVWRERLSLAQRVDLSHVQQALDDRTLLLDYWSGQASAVVAVSKSRASVLPIEVDGARISAWVDTLSTGPSSTWRDDGQAIGAAILPPADWFDGIDHIVVVADGPIALVPFDVLRSGEALLIERAAVSYTPTAATLIRRRSPTAWLPPWKLQLRGFADPVTAGDDRVGERDPTQRRLTGSAEEVSAVAGELGGGARLHVGKNNLKSALLDESERAPVIHLATHAVADASAMEQSRIMFSPPDESAAGSDFLYLKEAYALKLDGVELVVLSACDTERGRQLRGEGVQSFSRAFLAAGARSTITTLWRVADEPTVDFMRVFYHYLGRGVPRDEALRRVKLRFLYQQSPASDPHYWAAFVLSGEAMRPLPRAVTWPALAGVVLAAGAVLYIGLYFLRRKISVPR